MSGWFDEQLRARIEADENSFSEAFSDISEAITGARINGTADADSALQEIAGFYHVTGDIQGKTIDEVFGSCGIMRREVVLREGWYKDASGVYLGRTKDDRYIALMPSAHGYSYKDYTTGKRIRVNSMTQGDIKAEALCFYSPLPSRPLSIRDLLIHIAHSLAVSDLVYIAVITLFITLASMVSPFLIRIIYSQTIYTKDINNLAVIFVFIVCAGISAALLQVARTLALSRIEIKANVSVNAAVMMRIIGLPAEFFKRYSSGELAQRASGVGMLCSSMMNVIFSVGLTALMSLIYLRQIFIFTPVLVWPALLIMTALFVSSLLLTWGHSRIMKRGMKLRAEEYGLLYAFITGIQKIKLSGAERRAFAKWASHYKHHAKLEYDPPLYIKLTPVIQPAITLAGTFALYFMAYHAHVAPEDYMAFMSSYALLSGAFIAFCGAALSMASITSLLDLIKPVLEAVPEVSEGKILTRVRGGIELNSVSFRYSEKTPLILDNLSFKIRPGEYVAVVGRSGCGKSTLMRLLLGFEHPNNGVIYYDGRDIKTLDMKNLRRSIGCVMQNSRLFPGSIYSNIVISAPHLTEAQAWEAAEMAGIAEDIRRMPMRMNTLISEGSGTISGGQRQRIIIARAIAPRPKILLFDEATSALDNITQKIVADSLEKLRCTRVVIAHRLSTVRHCGRILVIDGGRIAESGNYEELMSMNGLFASLVERQQLGEEV